MLRNNNNKSTSAHKILFSHIPRMLRVSLKQKSEPSKIAFKNCKRKFWEQKATIYVSSTFPALGFIAHTTLHWESPFDYYIPDSSNQKCYKTSEQITQGISDLLLAISMKSHSGRCWISTSMQFCFHSSLYNKTNQGDLTPPKRKG